MHLNENDPASRGASRANQKNHQTDFSTKNEQTSQDKSAFVDALRLDFLCDLADSLTAKSVALRMACVEGDLNAIDNLFDCLRLLASEFVRTRSEIIGGDK